MPSAASSTTWLPEHETNLQRYITWNSRRAPLFLLKKQFVTYYYYTRNVFNKKKMLNKFLKYKRHDVARTIIWKKVMTETRRHKPFSMGTTTVLFCCCAFCAILLWNLNVDNISLRFCSSHDINNTKALTIPVCSFFEGGKIWRVCVLFTYVTICIFCATFLNDRAFIKSHYLYNNIALGIISVSYTRR